MSALSARMKNRTPDVDTYQGKIGVMENKNETNRMGYIGLIGYISG